MYTDNILNPRKSKAETTWNNSPKAFSFNLKGM
jgi:hypothetical protein